MNDDLPHNRFNGPPAFDPMGLGGFYAPDPKDDPCSPAVVWTLAGVLTVIGLGAIALLHFATN